MERAASGPQRGSDQLPGRPSRPRRTKRV